MTAQRILLRYGIRWLLVSDDGKNQRYRHPTDPHRWLSVIDPTYTFQPADADNYLYENSPNTNLGTNTSIMVDGRNGYRRRAILKFDLTSQIVAGSTINSATLSLYYYNYPFTNPSGRTFWAYRITQTAWTEPGSTWNKYDGTNSWGTAGGDYTTTGGASTTVPASYGWMAWTVTAQVQTAVDSVGRVAHFLMKDGDESGSTAYSATFWSRDYTVDTTKRPKLYVDWTEPAFVYVNVSDSGAGSDSIASLTATVPVTDSGVGTESDISVGPGVADAGVGVEAVTTSATMTVTDAGAGAESPTINASLSSSDSGVGADTPGIQNLLTETDAGIGSESPGTSASVPVAESGAGLDAPSMKASISVSDSAVGSEASVSPSASFTVADSGLGAENVTTPGTLTVTDEGKGAEFAWRIKPSNPMIDDLALPHILAIRMTDEASIADKKVQGGSLPRRKLVGKHGRVLEIEGWTDNQADIDALEALADGVRRTFYHPNGDSFSVLVTDFQPSRTVDQYNRRLYRLAVAEAN